MAEHFPIKLSTNPHIKDEQGNPVGWKGVPRAEERVRDIHTPILRGLTLSYITITHMQRN